MSVFPMAFDGYDVISLTHSIDSCVAKYNRLSPTGNDISHCTPLLMTITIENAFNMWPNYGNYEMLKRANPAQVHFINQVSRTMRLAETITNSYLFTLYI